jgi:hypothetical protein
MRITHDVDRPFQSGGACIPYAAKKGRKSTGFRVELILTPTGSVAHDDPYEEIRIDGNATHVLSMLRDAVAMIEDVGKAFVEKGRLVRDWEKR